MLVKLVGVVSSVSLDSFTFSFKQKINDRFTWKMLLVIANVLILFLGVCYADVKPDATPDAAQKRQDDDCNCESIGPWKPLFKPSPIVYSELPEHRHAHVFDIYSPRADLKLVPHVLVPVVNPVAYTLHHDFGSHEHKTNVGHEQPKLKYSLLDSSIRGSTDSNGKPVIKWEHYGDIKQISVKYKGDPSKNKNNRNRLSNHKLEESKPLVDSPKNKYKETNSNEEERQSNSGENSSHEHSEGDPSCHENDEDEKYFNSGSFFDGSFNSQEDMDVSKGFGSSKELFQEDLDLPKGFGDSAEILNEDNFSTLFNPQSHSEEISSELPITKTKPSKPATSYASISSLFSGIKSSHYSDVKVQHEIPVKSPYSNIFTHTDGQGRAQFVHHAKPAWFNDLNPGFNNKPIKYQEKHKTYSVHEHQPEEIRSYGYPKYSQHIENYYPLNKDYLLGDFWKNARKMEKMRPPPPGQTPTWFIKTKNKKPRTISFKRDDLIRNNKPFSYVYIIKTNKDSHPVFINH